MKLTALVLIGAVAVVSGGGIGGYSSIGNLGSRYRSGGSSSATSTINSNIGQGIGGGYSSRGIGLELEGGSGGYSSGISSSLGGGYSSSGSSRGLGLRYSSGISNLGSSNGYSSGISSSLGGGYSSSGSSRGLGLSYSSGISNLGSSNGYSSGVSSISTLGSGLSLGGGLGGGYSSISSSNGLESGYSRNELNLGGSSRGGYGNEKEIDYYAPAKYNYGYKVEDPHTGDIKSQEEVREGDVVKGSYSLKEADGTIRVVEYVADGKNGFNAQVKRIGKAVHVEQQQLYKN